jgi:hypothetical protein
MVALLPAVGKGASVEVDMAETTLGWSPCPLLPLSSECVALGAGAGEVEVEDEAAAAAMAGLSGIFSMGFGSTEPAPLETSAGWTQSGERAGIDGEERRKTHSWAKTRAGRRAMRRVK